MHGGRELKGLDDGHIGYAGVVEIEILAGYNLTAIKTEA